MLASSMNITDYFILNRRHLVYLVTCNKFVNNIIIAEGIVPRGPLCSKQPLMLIATLICEQRTTPNASLIHLKFRLCGKLNQRNNLSAMLFIIQMPMRRLISIFNY